LQRTYDNPWNKALYFNRLNLDAELGALISRSGRFELFWVLAGTKKVCCIPIREANIPSLIEWCGQRALTALDSGYRYTPLFEPAKGNYSNVARFGELRDGGVVYGELFISLNPEYAQIARASRFNDRPLGYVMGYPSCCIEFYIDWFDRQFNCGNDYVIPSASGLENYSYLNNTLLRYFDVSFTSHFPCSPQCAATAVLAENNLKSLREHSPELAEAMVRHLCSFVIYTENDGIAYSTDYTRVENTVYVNRSYSVRDTLINSLLSRHSEILIEAYDCFAIGGHRFSKDCRIIFFDSQGVIYGRSK
jgi:hypothetical protein